MDWGVIVGTALWEGLHAFQIGKNLRPVIQRYFAILFPPNVPPTPNPRPSKCLLEELTTSTWEEDNNVRPTDSPHPQPAQAPAPIKRLKHECLVHSRNADVSIVRMAKAWPMTRADKSKLKLSRSSYYHNPASRETWCEERVP